MRLGITAPGTHPSHGAPEPERGEIGYDDRGEHRDKHERPPPDKRADERDGYPHEPEGPDVAEPLEDRIQPAGPMVDDPSFELVVEVDQVGRSCLVDSISCRGSNGLPMKPRAPRALASSSEASSTLPLNITTGIDPTPCCSCTRRSISQPSTFGIITSSRMRSGGSCSSAASPSSALPASRTE